jgi:hypothetical protein
MQVSPLRISVFNSSGEEIAVLVDEFLNAGLYEKDWNAEGVSSGVYFCILEAAGFKESKKMIMLK